MTQRSQWLCECDADDCMREIDMPLPVAQRLSREGLIAIIDGCANGPSPGDELVEKKDGYAIYRPAK